MTITSTSKDCEQIASTKLDDDLADDECPNKRTHFYEFKEFEVVKSLIAKLPSNVKELREKEKSYEQFLYIIDCYQEQPHLIDPFLAEIFEKLIDLIKANMKSNATSTQNDHIVHEAFKYMHTLAKMRGFKKIVQYLPHEVNDFEPILDLLNRQDMKDTDNWQTRYMLLVWLSIVCMVPFDLHRFDGLNQNKSIMDRMLTITVPYLFSSDKCQDACAFVLAKFMSRADLRDTVLPDFFQQLFTYLQTTNKNKENIPLLGVLKCLSSIYKYGKREDLLKYTLPTLRHIIDEDLLVSSQLAVIRKFCIKIVQRVGITFFKAKVAKWRYQRGSRILMHNVHKQGSQPTETKKAEEEEEEEENDDEKVPNEIEDIIEQLLFGLKDKDTIVRWSSAKGIGRITNRLPKDMADDVLTSLLDVFTFIEDDAAWHGGCLAIAELGRRGLLLPQQLPNVVPIILKALIFDKKLGNYSLGRNVRDAACYVCWSLARAFDADIIKPYVNQIAGALLIVTVFDREVNCRRAASAAFQEHVGRQGQFPHGIDILTKCDYFAVGQIQNCYLNLSLFIAQFDEYRIQLIEHLIEHKFNHWDASIRELCSQAMFKLAQLCPDHMAFAILPTVLESSLSIDLNTRHGAILVLGELIHSLCENQSEKIATYFPNELISKLKEVLSKIFDEKYFKGSGGELIRPAVCLLVRKLSISSLFQYTETFDQMFLDECEKFLIQCVEYVKDTVQMAAVDALPYFCHLYFLKHRNSWTQDFKLVDLFIESSRATSKECVRSGYCLALGNLPADLLRTKSNFKRIVEELIVASKWIAGPITAGESQAYKENEAGWVLARRDAICALTSLLGKIESKEDFGSFEFSNDLIIQMFDCFFHGLNDYSIDSKGDSGSKVRGVSMQAIEKLTELVAKHSLNEFTNNHQLIIRIFAGIMQQAVERIDRTRSLAGRTFMNLLYNEYLQIDKFSFASSIKSVFTKDECERIDWNLAQVTLPMFAKLFSLAEFQVNLLTGFIYSIGSLTESLVKSATSSFLKQLQLFSKQDKQTYKMLIAKILELCKKHIKNERLGSSLVKTVDLVIQNDFLDSSLIDNSQYPNEFLVIFLENVKTTRDMSKLNAYVDVFCDMIQFEQDRVRERALTQLMILLCHQFAIVRKNTAAKLFESLINYPDLFETGDENDQCVLLLTDTVWDQAVDKIRPIRNQICDLLKVPKPVLKKPATTSSHSTTTSTSSTQMGLPT